MNPVIYRAQGISQNVTAGAAAANSTVVPQGYSIARIVATNGNVRFAVGTNATATAASPFLPQGQVEYVLITPNDRVSVIRDGAADVVVSVAFVSR